MPVLNGVKFLGRIADCVASQTYADYEVLYVVSDLSVDETLDEALRLSEGVDRARVLEYWDVGALGGSKNFGIDNALGDRICFFDVDDVPSPDYLSEAVRIMDSTGADVVGCNFVYASEACDFPVFEGDFGVRVMGSMEALEARAAERFPVTSWSMVIDAGLLRRTGLRFPDGIAEDIEFTYHLLMRAGKVCYNERPLYMYVVTPGSIVNNPAGRDRRGSLEVARYDALEEEFRALGMPDRFGQRFTLLRIRSAGHMSYRAFMRYVKGPEARSAIGRNASPHVLLEGAFACCLSTVYFVLIRAFFRLFYYSPGRTYTPLPVGVRVKEGAAA